EAEIEIGSIVTGYYDANAPMLMIYPPQYSVEVLVVEEEKEKFESIKVDLFDENLISADNTLKINLSDDTKIISKNGEKFEGDLTNRKLAVTYSFSTRSIPAQTTPTQIIVLSEEEIEEKGAVITSYDVSSMDIIVDNKKIEAPSAYENVEGEVMVPLRAIAEALGFDVSWEAETQSVRLGKGIVLTMDEKNYNYMKSTPIQLRTAPELVKGVTFVPLNFFREVVGMNNAYVFEAQIVIDDGEIMH
ncbi:MAG: copper amine oxidase N-terminal domain-containing protein, partial [Clostridiaceae bacterium]|nr:copper amine oxidase N-terminal domain-containing protein [Clostridiaceae bacterium]